MYRIGDVFKTDRNFDTYMLCQSESTKVALINLRNGNRWGTCCYVDDLFRISQKEFDRIAENIFNTDTWSKIEPVENIETKVSVMNTFSPETHMTRDGKELLQLEYFYDTRRWVGIIKDNIDAGLFQWDIDGNSFNAICFDLIKKKVKKSGWVVKDMGYQFKYTCIFNNKKDAEDRCILVNNQGLNCHVVEVHWEE